MITEHRKVVYKGRTFSIATHQSHASSHWLVFLHGLGCAKESFDDVFKTKLAKQFSILTFDFVGFGASDKPEGFDYTLEDQAQLTLSLIAQFNPDQVTLIGHSMGGAIGTLVARELDSLSGFINVEGNLVAQDSGIVSRRTAEQSEAVFEASGFDAFLKMLESSKEKSFHEWAGWYAASSKSALHRSSHSLVGWSDSGELLEYFNGLHNKAFIHGDRTDISHLTDRFTDVDVFSVPHSGHFMMLDNPDEFYDSIESFVGQ